MKFHKLGLTTAAAVLASIVSAGAYTQPAPQIATPVGSGVDGFVLYIGGGLSQLGGSVQNSQSVKSSTAISSGSTAQVAIPSSSSQSVANAAEAAETAYTALGVYGLGSNAAITQSEVLTVTGLKFGGEGHLGAYFGVAEGFGVGIEAFGVTRTSFNPISSTTILSNDLIGSTTALTATNAVAGTSATVEPTADAYTLGVNIKPNSLGYGVRMMPTVMISDQFGMYVSVGYGSQKVQGTLTNTAFSYVANQYYAAAASGTATGTASITGTLSKSLSGINYGIGSFFNVDETISIFSGLEVQKFNTYDVSSLNTGTRAPVAAGSSTGVTGVTTIAQASTTVPSTLKVQLNTYSVGIDYAFV